MQKRKPLLGFILCLFFSFQVKADGLLNRCQSVFNRVDSVDYFQQLKNQYRKPVVSTENSKYYLFDAVSAVSEKIRGFESEPAFVQGVKNVGWAVEKATGRYGLSSVSQKVLSNLIEIAVAQELGLQYYSKLPKKSEVSAAVDEIGRLVEIDQSFDIPALAGYSAKSPRKIYIDRDINSKESVRYLMIHEFVEKSLIDTLDLKSEIYLRTHQIAQRIEKAVVEIEGGRWHNYQHVTMKEEIDRAWEKAIQRVPADLDLTPYELEMTPDRLQNLKNKFVKINQESIDTFSVKEIIPGLFHLNYKDQRVLAKAMMRFQEHFESPEFKGKVFSRREFSDWYRQKNGKFDYYQYWDGINFPSYVLEAFYQKKFSAISVLENQILKLFKNKRHSKIYIIATADNSGELTLDHEVAHALYYFNSNYKEEVGRAMSRYDLSGVKDFLFTTVGDYHKDVLHDEAHAWLMHNKADLIKEGMTEKDLEKLDPLILDLQNIYRKFTQVQK